MVTFVIPIVCETSARWLCNGRSSTKDCAGVTCAVGAKSRHNNNACNPVLSRNGFNVNTLNMQESPFKAQLSPCASIANFSKTEGNCWPTPVQRLRRTRIRAVSSHEVRSFVSGELFEQIGLFSGDAREERLKLEPSGEVVSDL